MHQPWGSPIDLWSVSREKERKEITKSSLPLISQERMNSLNECTSWRQFEELGEHAAKEVEQPHLTTKTRIEKKI